MGNNTSSSSHRHRMRSESSVRPDIFFSDELKRALDEQAFGITSFQISTSITPLEATAFVNLLEGNVVTVTLCSRGYNLVMSNKGSGQTFEAIEDLLQAISPAYGSKRQEALVSKLQGLKN